ncbi:PKD1L3 [Branchiostoma lanceolatum]|nr:PKD1L3 [Branchiostoma lanceolatum]
MLELLWTNFKFLQIYTTLIRPVLEYSSQVWGGLPRGLSDEVEMVQKTCCRIIGIPSDQLPTLEKRRREAYVREFGRVVADETHPCRHFLVKSGDTNTYCEDLGWEQSNQLSDAQLLSTSGSFGNHAFEVLRTANQQYNGVDFLAINARLPANGLSNTSDWCRDYQNLCAEFGLRPTGCGEDYAVQGGSNSYAGHIRCVPEYNSDPYINNVLGFVPAGRVAEVANLAFSAGATWDRSFGFNKCETSHCQRGIRESHYSLYRTTAAFGSDGSGDRIVYTVCAGSAAVQCPTLTPPGNGTMSPIGANYSYNDEVTFTCNQGYRLEGASSVRCQADRTWSDPVPRCTRNHAFEVLHTANQQYRGVDFLAINARLPANGLSNTSDWCRDYQNLCAEYGLRPTGCREEGEAQGGNSPDPPDTVRCVTEYNSDPYINNALGCGSAKRVAEVANLAFSAGASFRRCFSFYGCQTNWCQRGIHESHWSLHLTEEAFGSDGSGDRIVYTVCAGSAAVQCPTLTPPDNGALSPIGANSYNAEVTFTCNPGYKLEGASSVRCQANRTWSWSDSVPTCTDVDACLTSPCDAQATCTDNPPPALDATCTCNTGYTGDGLGTGTGCAECGHCQGGGVNCDPMSGVCSAGCQDGWKTQICKETVEPPMNLNVTDITDEGFKVTWSPSPDPDLQAYRVVVSELDMTTSVNQTTGETWLQVVGLTSETDYIIRVTVLVLSDSRWSQSNATTTEATTIMSSSTDLEFVNVTETTSKLRVTWVPPDAVVTGYRIMYGQEEATERLNPSPGPGDRSALLEGLQPDTMYKVEIITIGVGQESLPLIGQNATEPDECATVNGRCDHICSNVPGGYRCQCHQGFVLMADAHGCGVCGQCQGGDVNCDPMSGVCSAGCQDGWKTQLCDKAVDPPMDLAVTDITDEGFKVTWAPSPDPDLEGYRVVVSKLDMTTVNKTSDKASFPVVGLSPETDYIIRVTALFSSGGWRSQSEATMIVAATGSTPTTTPAPAATTTTPAPAATTTTPAPAATTTQTRRRTTLLSTEPATLTVSVGGEESSDEATATTEQTSGMATVQSTRPSTPTVRLDFGGDGGSTSVYYPVTKTISEQPGDNTQGTKETSSRPPVGNRATPDQALGNSLDSLYAESVSPHPQDVLQKLAQNADVSGDAAVLGQPTSSAAEEKAQDMAVSVLKSITSNLDQLDMSDPSTVESVGGSLLDSVGSLLEDPERGAEEVDGKPAPDLEEEDQSLSPKERLEKAKEKEQKNQAKKRRLVQESHRVLDGLYNAIIGAMRLGAPPVTIERGGIVLRAQKVRGDQFGGQLVQTEGGSFHVPSKAALFPDYTPHNVAIKLTQFEQNPFTWGRGEHQARSSVMELSLQQNNIPVAFNNLTEDFYITIPGGSGNKPATTTITFPAPGNKSSSYHLLNLTNTAEGFLVTITPLNRSVVYGISGRYGGRPDDQNYSMSMETYVLPEECALMKTLSGDEDKEKREATMFISGEDGPVDYYIKVQIRGPVTECDFEKKDDVKESHANDFYAYQIQWARLSCVYWSETKEDWSTDGCTISKQSTISSTICHCNHLTAFGSDFATPPNTFDFGELNFSDLVDNVAVVATIIAALCLYFSTTAVVTIAERRGKRMLHQAVKLDNLQNGCLYRLLIWTGAAKHAGTESTLSFKLFGAAANSDVRVVDITEKVFTQNSQVTLTFSTAEQLGNVELLQLMHDNSGEGSRASWNVDRAAVQDLTTGKLFYFFCGEWLAADRGDGQVVKTFPVATEQDLRSFGFLFQASLQSNLAEEHLFLSVAIMPEDSVFTRSERLGCCLSLLLMSMVSSAMWLREEIGAQVVQAVSLGPFSFTLNGVYTGVMTSITCLPVIMAIVLLFQYSRPSNKGDRRVRDVETGGPAEAPAQQGPAKRLPHWCKYVAWVLVVLSAVGSAVFTTLYSLMWGKDKSERWLSAYFTTFLVDMFLLQPAKILLLTILTSSIRKPQAVQKIFEEKRGPVSIDARTVSSQKARFSSDAFRMRRKMEHLSMTSLANIKQARMRQRRDRRVVNTFWDIMWFCCCLLIVISIANEHHNTTEGFYQTQSMTNTFVQSMDEVNDPLTFWSWLYETALGNFYPETSYKGGKPRWQDKSFTADMQSVLVYPPSLIQGRVQTGLCTVPVTMQHLFDECSSAYDEHTKETGAFEKGWKRVRNTSAMESEAPGWIHLPSAYPSLPIYGVTTQYWGDGFGLHLGKSADEMRSILAELKAHRWIDKRTRVIFLEAVLYNGNLDLFTSVTMVFEFSETAGVFSHHHVHTFRLHQRPGTIGYIYVLLEVIYVIILLYTLWTEGKAARAAGLAYLMEPWNIVEIFNFILAFTVIVLYGFKIMYSFKALMAIKEGKDLVHHFRSAVNISLVYGWFLAFLTFVNMMKLLRLVRFNPFLSKLMSVFRGMAGEFCSFILYFFFWLSAFGIYAYLMFGLTVTEYSTISKSFSTLFQMSLGNFYYYQLKEAAPILGPIYFFAFISLIFLVLMNIAMAIIDSALPDVRNHDMPEEDQYFIQGLWERFTAFFGFWKMPVTG